MQQAEALAYMAGIIDGEGSICIFETYGKNKRYGTYSRTKAIVTVANTSEDLMRWINTNFGGAMWRVKRRRGEDGSGRWKVCYHWELGHTKASDLLLMLLPYLVVKKKQAELFLEHQGTMKKWGKSGVPASVLETRESLMGEVKALNRRGAH
jgi:hypothetical protein